MTINEPRHNPNLKVHEPDPHEPIPLPVVPRIDLIELSERVKSIDESLKTIIAILRAEADPDNY